MSNVAEIFDFASIALYYAIKIDSSHKNIFIVKWWLYINYNIGPSFGVYLVYGVDLEICTGKQENNAAKRKGVYNGCELVFPSMDNHVLF